MNWISLSGIDEPSIFDIANFDCFVISDSSLKVWHLGRLLVNQLISNSFFWKAVQLVVFNMMLEMRYVDGLEGMVIDGRHAK